MIWRSPLRTPRFTTILGLILLAGLPVMFVTGLLSYAAYNPNLGGPNNDLTPDKGFLGFYLFDWPTDPSWLYQLTQGLHVILGLALIPVLLAKLWSVIPKLFVWPPVRSRGHAAERASLVMLVGGGVFVFVTGVLNIQELYVFPVSFYTGHFYGAWIFVAGLAIHLVVKFPTMVTALRNTGSEPAPEPPVDVAQRGSVSRRGALATVGGTSLLIVLLTAGQATGGRLRDIALLAPRGRGEDFPVNRTAAQAGVTEPMTGSSWALELRGTRTIRFSRKQLLELPQHTERLTLACVEGWSTTQNWTGVRLADLAKLAGMPGRADVFVESLQRHGAFGTVRLRDNQVIDQRSLLALAVNGEELDLDHGYPARVIVPNNPGVHNTKWVSRMTFTSTERAT